MWVALSAYKVLSFGGGVQTTALGILVSRGEVDTDVMVFADTGGELPQTYRHLWRYSAWLAERGWPLHVVRSPSGTLEQWIHERSAPIPVRVGSNEGLGHRQCTRQWKIQPVLEFARRQAGDRPIIMQLGISLDEAHRMKESPDKDIKREWPLIDLGLTREDCRRIILDEGFTSVPKSSCYYCPLLPAAHFRRLASEQPDLFENAARIEDSIIGRRVEKGQKPAYLTPHGRPLRELYSGDQLSLLPGFDDGQEGAECEGTCFV